MALNMHAQRTCTPSLAACAASPAPPHPGITCARPWAPPVWLGLSTLRARPPPCLPQPLPPARPCLPLLGLPASAGSAQTLCREAQRQALAGPWPSRPELLSPCPAASCNGEPRPGRPQAGEGPPSSPPGRRRPQGPGGAVQGEAGGRLAGGSWPEPTEEDWRSGMQGWMDRRLGCRNGWTTGWDAGMDGPRADAYLERGGRFSPEGPLPKGCHALFWGTGKFGEALWERGQKCDRVREGCCGEGRGAGRGESERVCFGFGTQIHLGTCI